MCVVALAWQSHPDWPLILVGNRDEFHARPTAPLDEWDSGIMAGRDLQAGGTWLGVHAPSGRIAVVTNVRGDSPDPAKQSRGALVIDMLNGRGSFADPVEDDLDRFNAFNLLIVRGAAAQRLVNRPQPRIDTLAPGVHALANEPVDQPCPRAARLAAAMEEMVRSRRDPATLLDTLRHENDPALFLRGDIYGTRASTLVLIANDGQARMIERRYEAGGRPGGTTALQFRIG